MSKHKRLHSITGKGKFAKFAGFVGTHYSPQLKEKAPASSAKADGDGMEQTLTGPVPSYDNTNMKEDAR